MGADGRPALLSIDPAKPGKSRRGRLFLFQPVRAARLEVEWWRVHREHQYDPAVPGDLLVSALVDLYSYVYAAPADSMRAAAVNRVEAMDLSDRWVANGCDLGDPLLAAERLRLVASHAALLDAAQRAVR